VDGVVGPYSAFSAKTKLIIPDVLAVTTNRYRCAAAASAGAPGSGLG
jgi:hypothetical protein